VGFSSDTHRLEYTMESLPFLRKICPKSSMSKTEVVDVVGTGSLA